MAPPRGRSEIEKKEIIEKILYSMSELGMTSPKACKAAGITPSVMNLWVDGDKELAVRYARARADVMDRLAQEVLEIADAEYSEEKPDNGSVQARRLQIDSRKWLLSKLAPHKYGEHLELSGNPDRPVATKIERVIIPAIKGDKHES